MFVTDKFSVLRGMFGKSTFMGLAPQANPKIINGKLHYKSLNGEWKPCLYHKVSRKERMG